MSLWMIIYVGSQIGGVAGPLPYDMAECRSRRDEMRSNAVAFLADGIDRSTGKPAPVKNIEITKTMRFECEHRDTRPMLGDPA